MVHELKLQLQFCDAVNKGTKPFEVRRNDRNYQVGDIIQFKPVDYYLFRVSHDIEKELFEITYILDGWGIEEGFVVMGIRKVNRGKRRKEIMRKEGLE